MKHLNARRKHPNIPTRKTHGHAGQRGARGARAGEQIGPGPGTEGVPAAADRGGRASSGLGFWDVSFQGWVVTSQFWDESS